MPPRTLDLTPEEQQSIGITPPAPGDSEVEPNTVVEILDKLDHGIYRRNIKLSAKDEDLVIEAMAKAVQEWKENSAHLMSKIKLWTNLEEGVRPAKDFPWKNSSNLHIPMTETHIMIGHAVARSTLLDVDPVYQIRDYLPGKTDADKIDAGLEWFLSHAVRNGRLDDAMSMAMKEAFARPLGITRLDWMEDIERRDDILLFASPDEFFQKFPDPASVGLSEKQYQKAMDVLADQGQLQVRVEEDIAVYRGPRLCVVHLKDLVLWPATSPSFKYAKFVGDRFTQRKGYFKKMARLKWYSKESVDELLAQPGMESAADDVEALQDRIDGLGRNSDGSMEYEAVQGVLKIELSNDEDERSYFITYAPSCKKILRFEHHPYLHNRCPYQEWGIVPRVNRLMRMCFYDMLFDLNEEVDTQHNMRIDSRAITTVPSFKRKTAINFDPTREDQKFFPGVTFEVQNMNDIEQFDIKQTDLGSSLQEESFIFQIAEAYTGAVAERSGRSGARDPRASGRKILALLGQSDLRMNDYLKEFSKPMKEIAEQVLELYYQFAPGAVIQFPFFSQEDQVWLTREIARTKLRNDNMRIDVARSTVEDNPALSVQKKMVEYQILEKNELIRGNLLRYHALTRDLVIAMRKKNADLIIPPRRQYMQEVKAQQGLVGPNMPPNIQALMGNLLNNRGSQGPNGVRQGGPDVSVGSLDAGQTTSVG